MSCCAECSDDVVRRVRCAHCGDLVCPWCYHHFHKRHVSKQRTPTVQAAETIRSAIKNHREQWCVGELQDDMSFRIDLPADDDHVETLDVQITPRRRQ